MKARVVGLLGWVGLCFAAAAVGGVGSATAGPFYAALARPAWAPPGWIFGPVWSALYLLMGVAAWLVWRDGGFRAARGALLLFLLQLIVNALWSWLFFRWHLGAAAMADVLLLWGLLLACALAFGRHRPLAAVLLLPYLAWVTFATALTWAVWRANPHLLG